MEMIHYMDIRPGIIYEVEFLNNIMGETMKWYVVEIEPDERNPVGFLTLSPNLKKEIEQWIIEHYNDADFGVWKDVGFCKYGFRNEEDAMAFKLRWI